MLQLYTKSYYQFLILQTQHFLKQKKLSKSKLCLYLDKLFILLPKIHSSSITYFLDFVINKSQYPHRITLIKIKEFKSFNLVSLLSDRVQYSLMPLFLSMKSIKHSLKIPLRLNLKIKKGFLSTMLTRYLKVGK